MASEASEPSVVDHRCRSGRWCVARSGDSAAATSKPDTLCVSCLDAVQLKRDKLIQIQEAVRLFVGIKPVTAMQSRVSATKEPQSPLNLAAEALVTDIDEIVSRVGNYMIRDLVAQPSKLFKVWRGDCEQLVYWDGADLALQVAAVHRRATKLLGFEAQWERRSAPCWSCSMPFLGQLTGSATVECSNCGERKPDTDYQAYCLEMIKGKQKK